MIGTLMGLGSFASYSELTVMQTSGFTRFRITLSVLKIVIILIIVFIFISEWISPVSEQLAKKYRAEKVLGNSIVLNEEGIWLKDNYDFVHIKNINNSISMKDISIYSFDKQNKLISIIFAPTADYNYNNKSWLLSGVNKATIINEKKIIVVAYRIINWKTSLTPDKLSVISLNPDSLSIRGLHKYIKYLKKNNQIANIYELSMWKKIFVPFSTIVMTITSISFIFGPLRTVSIGVRIVSGVLGGFLFYVLNQLISKWSLIYSAPPIIAAIVPSLLFLIFSTIFIINKE